MALATASNWLFNFLISFFTTFITNDIGYLYGLVFAGCCFAMFWVVYFFVIESKDRSLEEIDTMYVLHVNPRTSAKWKAGDAGATEGTGAGTTALFSEAEVKESKEATQDGREVMVSDEERYSNNPTPQNEAEIHA
jgi:SP family sugar:H+ symporter-like MFS transporter